MAPRGTIKSFFRRPTFASADPDVPATTTTSKNDPSAEEDNDRATSPLSEPPPSSSLARNAPELFSSSPVVDQQPHQQQVQNDLKEASKIQEQKEQKEDKAASARETSFGSSTASHRTIKNGREVVTGSDGEESDSAASLESPEDLFAQILGPKTVEDDDDKPTRKKTSKSTLNKNKSLQYSVPKYKNTLEALVTEAVGDNETEAGIAQLRATLTKSEDTAAVAAANADTQGKPLHEDMLTSALGDQGDEQGYQRLLDAVRRTEVFEQDKTVSVFTHDAAPAPEFPKSAVAPGTYLAVLRGWSFILCFGACVANDKNPIRVNVLFIPGLSTLLCRNGSCPMTLSRGFSLRVCTLYSGQSVVASTYDSSAV